MKSLSPILSAVVLIAISVVAISIVLNVGLPSIEKAKETAIVSESVENLKTLSSIIDEVALEGEGAQRIITLTISGGEYIIDALKDQIQFKKDVKSESISLGVSKKEKDITISRGTDVKAYSYDQRDDNNLLVYYSFDNFNDTVEDESVYENTGYIFGSVNKLKGIFGNSSYFDESSYITVNYWFNTSFPYRRPITITDTSGSTLTDYQVKITLDTQSLISQNKMKSDCGDIRFIWKPSDWFNTSFPYRRPITITDTSGSTLTDYQVKITLDTQSLISQNKMKSDCGDIRFYYTNSSGTYEIPYWIEDGTCNTPNTNIWIKIPEIPANGQTTVYMYYGNPATSSQSNITETFIFGDDFNDGVLDTNKWEIKGSPSYTESGGYLNIDATGTYTDAIQSIDTFSYNIILTYKAKLVPNNPAAIGFWVITESGSYENEIIHFYYDTQFNAYTRDASGSVTSTAITMDTANEHYYTIKWYNDGNKEEYYEDENLLASHSVSITGIKKVGLRNGGNFNFVFVRKYSPSEPTISIGDEQIQTKQQIPYWIEDGTCNTPNTNIWIKIPEIPANGQTTVYMYYGNPATSSQSNITETFIFGDDFNDGVLDSNKWENGDNWGTLTVSFNNGMLGIDDSGNSDPGTMVSKYNFDVHNKVIVESRNYIKYDGYIHILFLTSYYGTDDWRFGILDYDPGYSGTSFGIQIHPISGGWVYPCSLGDLSTDYEYQKLRIIDLGNGTFYAQYLDDNNNLINSCSYTFSSLPTNNIFIRMFVDTTITEYYDYIFIRKYSPSEPTVSIGSEQHYNNETYSLTNKFSIDLWFKTNYSWFNTSFPYRRPITITDTSGTTLTDYQTSINISYNSHMKTDFSDIRFIWKPSDWFNTSFPYRRPITITDTSGSTLTDYQVKITLDTQSLISQNKMKSDCGDIRFIWKPSDWFNTSFPYRRPITITDTSGTTLTDYQVKITLDTQSLISQNKMKSDCGDIRFIWKPPFKYRTPITITDTSGTTLTDYQVKITLDTQSLISQNKMKSDCGDIRFYYTNSSGTYEIPYWIEDGTCNTPNTNIWIKVPEIPASSSTTVYMYYGNPDAESESNGDQVFIGFEDFKDISDLTIATTGDNFETEYVSYINRYAMRLDNTLTDGGIIVIKNLGQVLDNVVIEYLMYADTGSEDNYPNRIVMINAPGDGTRCGLGIDLQVESKVEVWDNVDCGGGAYNSDTTILPPKDKWIWVKVVISGSSFKLKYWDYGTSEPSSWIYDVTHTPGGGYGTYMKIGRTDRAITGIDYFANIIIRKYSPSEPTISIGDEQIQTKQQIPYWIEDGTCNTPNTNIWIKIPEIPANGQTTVYMYYGNPATSSQSNITETFIFGDDFNDGVLDSNKWAGDTSIASESDGVLTITGSSSYQTIYSVNNFETNEYIVEAKTKETAAGYSIHILSRAVDSNNFIASVYRSTESTGILRIGGDGDAWLYRVSSNSAYSGSWLRFKTIEKNDNSIDFYLYDNNFNLVEHGTATDSSISKGKYGLGVYSGSYEVDYIIIRKYSPSEPTVSIGDEQIQTKQQIPYWIEDGTCNTPNTNIWIKVPEIPANGQTTVYMYYGNPSAVSQSNITETFIFGDDFNDNNKDPKWVDVWWDTDCSDWVEQNTHFECVSGRGCQAYYNMYITPPFIVQMHRLNSAEGTYYQASLYLSNVYSSGRCGDHDFCIQNGYYNYGDSQVHSVLNKNTGLSYSYKYLSPTSLGDTYFYIYVLPHKTIAKVSGYLNGENVYENTSENFIRPLVVSLYCNRNYYDCYYDYVLVRKYSSSEPTISIGDEQIQTEQQISYWIEEKSDGGWAKVWIKVPEIPANGQTTVYMYYGNPSAVSQSNITETFIFGDDFEDGILDTNKWAGAQGVTEENGYVECYNSDSDSGFYSIRNDFGPGIVLEYQHQIITTDSNFMHESLKDSTVLGDINADNSIEFIQKYSSERNWQTEKENQASYETYSNNERIGDIVRLKIEWTTTSVNFYEDNSLVHSHTDTTHIPTTSNLRLLFGGRPGDKFRVYWVFLRKYSSSEPTVSIGSEQHLGSIIEKSNFFLSVTQNQVCIKIANYYNCTNYQNKGWNHLVFEFDNTTTENNIIIYINGNKTYEDNCKEGINPDFFTIGKYWVGQIDDFKIYNETIPDWKVKYHYYSTLPLGEKYVLENSHVRYEFPKIYPEQNFSTNQTIQLIYIKDLNKYIIPEKTQIIPGQNEEYSNVKGYTEITREGEMLDQSSIIFHITYPLNYTAEYKLRANADFLLITFRR